MTEFILKPESDEFINNRNSTKIVYLQNEIRQLNEHIKDLKEIVRLNKEALQFALNVNGSSPTTAQAQALSKANKQSILSDKNSNSSMRNTSTISNKLDLSRTIAEPSVAAREKDTEKSLKMILANLNEENTRLLSAFDKLTLERDLAQSRALLSEQIAEEAQKHEAEMVVHVEERLQDLRRLIQEKEFYIQELEKLKSIPETENIYVKYREVMSPSEQNLKLHQELEFATQNVAELHKRILLSQKQNIELRNINMMLTTDIAKIRAALTSPLNAGNILAEIDQSHDLNRSAIVKPLSYIGSPDAMTLRQYTMAPSMTRDSPGLKPIMLDEYPKQTSLKVSPSMMAETIESKLAAARTQDTKVPPKFEELEKLKRFYEREKFKNRVLTEEFSALKHQVEQMQSVNSTLLKGYKNYEERVRMLQTSLKFYKQFYHKYINAIKSPWKHSSISLGKSGKLKQREPSFLQKVRTVRDANSGELLENIDEEVTDELDEKQINVSILEAEEATPGNRQSTHRTHIRLHQDNEDQGWMNKDQCKVYLLNLAKDLYMNFGMKNSYISKHVLKKLDLGGFKNSMMPAIRMKRSVSNPIDYIHEKKKQLYDDRNLKNRLSKLNNQTNQTNNPNNPGGLKLRRRNSREKVRKKSHLKEVKKSIAGFLFNDMSQIVGNPQIINDDGIINRTGFSFLFEDDQAYPIPDSL